jgi:hypothetical protein
MTTTPNKSDLPVYDFSTTPEQRAAEQAKQDAAIASAKAAAEKMYQDAGKVLNNPKKKDAPAVTKAKQGLVGISKDENEYIQQVLQMIADDSELGSSNPNYVKIQARYNK